MRKKEENNMKAGRLRFLDNDPTIGVESQTVSRCRFRRRPRLFYGGSRSCGAIEGAWVGMVVLQLERNGALFGVHQLVRPKSA